MKKNYIVHSTCYDKELFRRIILCLKDNNIDFNMVNINSTSSVRAPMSIYFESEIYINETDFSKADQLLKDVIREFS